MRKVVLLLAALLVLAPACSALGTAPAATIGGTEISTDSIEVELKSIRGNEEYTQRLEDAYGSPSSGTSAKGTFNAAFTAQVLSLRIWHELIDQDLRRRGVDITDEIREQSESDVREQFATLGEDVFEEFPPAYQDQLITQRAILTTMERMFVDEVGDDPRAFFRAHPEEFADICVSHVLVSVGGGRSPEDAEAAARALRERIDDGEDFETIASEESDDPGAAAQAGALGCGSKQTLQFVPEFETAAFALDEGEVSEPVLTQFGAHLILVTERTIPTYADVGPSVPTVMRQFVNDSVNGYLVEVICATDVSVNPRYGSWSNETCDGASPRLPSVVPPEGPASQEPEPSFPFEG